MQKVLIYSCAAIGDTVITVPLIRNICRHHAGAIIDFFNFGPGVSDYQLKLLDNIGKFRHVSHLSIPYALTIPTWRKRLNNLIHFRREKYDAIYVFYLEGVPKWWKVLFKFITGTTKLYVTEKAPSGERKSEFLRIQMEKSGMPFLPEEATLRYPLTKKNLLTAENRFSTLDIPKDSIPFVMGISGNSHPSMLWPLDRYDELLKRIVTRHNLYPIITGAPSEKEPAEFLLNSCKRGAFVCDLDAPDLIAFMKHSRFYLGNDTGTMHMADSAGLPCITLFMNKDSYMSWFPEGIYHINIIHRQPCEDCRQRVCPKGTLAPCINAITVEEVESAIEDLLNRLESPGSHKFSEH